MPEEENKVEETAGALPIRKPKTVKSKSGKKLVHADEVAATREEGEELEVDEVEPEEVDESPIPKTSEVRRIIVRLSGKEYYQPVFYTKEIPGHGLAIYGPAGQLIQAPVKHEDEKTSRELRAKLARNVARFNEQQRRAVHPNELQPVPQVRAR